MNQKYDRLTVYFFSGTGNAKACAGWICETAEKSGLAAEMIDISKVSADGITPPGSGTLTGFCGPTHGFNFPFIMRKFIRKFPSVKGNDVFILNTRGGVKFYKFILPGLSGSLHYLSSLVLILKGYRIAGLYPVDMPANWTSLHPAMKETAINFIYSRQKMKVGKFAAHIISGSRVYRALFDLIQDMPAIPVSIAYCLVGRFILSKTYYASHECNKCLRCQKECPVDAIRIVNGRMFWTLQCESCMHCMNVCPQKAIETSHGFLAAFVFFYVMAVSPLLEYLLKVFHEIRFIQIMNTPPVLFIIKNAAFLILFIPVYRIFHFLLRYKIIERIMTLTSLTHLKFWGRYKAPEKF
ncbi:MAG: EFR1 family ferrodoxin [Spirochaetes bacterium]|nr:EFR1 family ferrodoxin [Spirochaetota bacterium]